MTNFRFTLSLSFFVTFLLIPSLLSAQQAPAIEWQKCLGGSRDDVMGSSLRAILPTTDGGFLAYGRTESVDGDVSCFHAGNLNDIWVVKLTSLGAIVWQKCFGGSGNEDAQCIIQTSDKGYAIAGWTTSRLNDGDVSGFHGGSKDAWVIKIDTTGSIQWQKCLGGTKDDEAFNIIQTSDGGFAVAGRTWSDDEGLPNHGDADAYVAKLDAKGNVVWENCYGGSSTDGASAVLQTPDDGYLFASTTYSTDTVGDVSGNHGTVYLEDIWLVRLNAAGKIEWQKCIGGSSFDEAWSFIKCSDGGYAIAGNTSSNDGDISGNKGGGDMLVLKLDSACNILWQKCYGGTGIDGGNSIIETKEKGFLIIGSTYSTDGDVSGKHGPSQSDSTDAWLVKISPVGVLEWQKCLGGTANDFGFDVISTRDGGYAVSGETESNDFDVSGNHGRYDLWIVKLKPAGNGVETSTITTSLSLTTYPNPATKNLTLGYDLPKAAADVVISISDVTGRRIKEIHADRKLAGHNEMTLDLSRYAEGTYYITVSVGDLSETTVVEVVR